MISGLEGRNVPHGVLTAPNSIKGWGRIALHPITVIEIIVSCGIIILFLFVSFTIPHVYRKSGLLITLSLTVTILGFFALRPFWIDYQVTVKKEALNDYLKETYPGEEWDMNRPQGRQYNPYHLDVRFKNEAQWIYTYSVVNPRNICQSGWATPDTQVPSNGKHYEKKHCD
ncbi:hypothetical protein AB1K84_00800 [Mesobacillus foraminis]|uniref:hypothetical protein n=1 Tax=Mesobacillus foraminis TaxID=279826 RepID=UPI0039A1C8BD